MLLLPSVRDHHPHVFLTRELLAQGYDDRRIAHLCRAEVLSRLRHGAYTWTEVWKSLDEVERRKLVAWADLRVTGAPSVLSHTSAADQYGVPVWDLPPTTHLLRLDQRAGRRRNERAQHRGAVLLEDVTVRDGVPLTSGTRTAFDVMSIADVERSLVVVNGLLHAGETTLEHLWRFEVRADYWPHSLHHRIVLRLADPRIESVGETRTLHLCWSQHLPLPVPQVAIRDASGRVRHRVDFAWPELGVWLEFDGAEKYKRYRRPGESLEDFLLREKRRQQLIEGLTGWRCIRITWADLYHPERTAARIRAALNGELWVA